MRLLVLLAAALSVLAADSPIFDVTVAEVKLEQRQGVNAVEFLNGALGSSQGTAHIDNYVTVLFEITGTPGRIQAGCKNCPSPTQGEHYKAVLSKDQKYVVLDSIVLAKRKKIKYRVLNYYRQ